MEGKAKVKIELKVVRNRYRVQLIPFRKGLSRAVLSSKTDDIDRYTSEPNRKARKIIPLSPHSFDTRFRAQVLIAKHITW